MFQSRDWVDVDSGATSVPHCANKWLFQSRDWVDVDSGLIVQAGQLDQLLVSIPRLG